MNPDWWWVAAAGALGLVGGVAGTLVVASFLLQRPMDGHRYTGELPPPYLHDVNRSGPHD